ncbi:zinc ribbon domain-containing protein [Natronorarus salvus]|uniref:zinc ribbon domain-containing protein n=1 Tax=Natronorarus salvus TaxID=3117733 RepID=UPI002F25F32C
MDCPRCGGALSRLRFEGREALVCDGCGYADVEVDQRRERVEAESWAEAIERFRAGT